MNGASEEFEIPPTAPEDMALLHFTSGTTGKPKGAVHAHQAVLAHHVTGKYALDLHPDDIFWCTADPGWVTGTSYGIIAPLTHGVTSIIDEADFDAERWYRIIQEQKVTVWYTAPTAMRMLMKAGTEIIRKYDLVSLRFIASVGEPLNPEAVVWGQEAFGLPIHDNWWQTETGGIMIANYLVDGRSGPVRWAGRCRASRRRLCARRQGRHGARSYTEPERSRRAGVAAGLAVDVPRLSARRGALSQVLRRRLVSDRRSRPARCRRLLLVRRPRRRRHQVRRPPDRPVRGGERADGASGRRRGRRDRQARPGDRRSRQSVRLAQERVTSPSEALRMELLGFARRKLGPAVAPREIEFRDSLPKTRSGKIMRRLLKARELGLPEGDLSTLESD